MFEKLRKLLIDPHDYLPKKEKHDRLLADLRESQKRAQNVKPFKYSQRHFHEANFVGNRNLRGN